MIDIHSHIIPFVDDGSKTLEDSKKMLESAYKAGITKIVLTPHYIEGKYIKNKQEIAFEINRLESIKNELGYNNIELIQGNEIMVDANSVGLLENGNLSTINNTRYVLIEFSLTFKPCNIEMIIQSFLDSDFIPIIAHPERYLYVQKDISFIEKCVEYGALTQMNINSIDGSYGKEAKKTVIKLLKKDLIHTWGSDVHFFRDSYSNIDKCFKKVIKTVRKKDKYNKILFENSNKIINNYEI